MTATNYLAIVITHSARVQHGIALHELVFPFDAADMRSLTAATSEANKMEAKLEKLEVPCILATYVHCDTLDDLPSILTPDEVYAKRYQAPSGGRNYVRQYPNGRYPDGSPFKHGNKIGAAA